MAEAAVAPRGAGAGSGTQSPATALAGLLPVALLGLIVAAALLAGWLYATRVPKWNAPDEPAHFNYVRALATTGQLPVLQPGDYDVAKVEERMAAGFPDSLPVDWMRYESHQPPLYYALGAGVYRLVAAEPVEAQVTALRLLSTAIGALALVVAYLLVRQVYPGDPALAVAATGVMAFVPMRVAMYAAVENDALAELVFSAALLALVSGLRRRAGWRYDALVGALLGAALLTKVVAYVALGLAPMAYLMAEVGQARGEAGAPAAAPRGPLWRRLAVRLTTTYAVAALVSGWWFARNLVVYGGLDVFGLQRHAQVVAGQPLTGALTAGAVKHFALTAFRSFWAQFGWMGIVVDERIYELLAALCALAGLGLILHLGRVALARGGWPPWQRQALALLAGAIALVGLGVVAYNLQYLQPQGRYFFPALAPLALLLTLGLRELVSRDHERLLLGLLVAGLFGLTLVCLFWFVVPAFAR